MPPLIDYLIKIRYLYYSLQCPLEDNCLDVKFLSLPLLCGGCMNGNNLCFVHTSTHYYCRLGSSYLYIINYFVPPIEHLGLRILSYPQILHVFIEGLNG